MPYIKESQRNQFDHAINDLPEIETPGQLNYIITTLIISYARKGGKVCYDNICEVTGVLENAKQEFYRRIAAPYEDTKIKQNGDVY